MIRTLAMTATAAPRAELAPAVSPEAAFDAFYARTARPLWAFLRASGSEPTLADDLLQESYVRLLASDLDEASESGRRAYLYRIASNLLRDHWRRRGRVPEAAPLEDAHAEVAAPPATADWQRLDLRRALAALSLRDRQLLWLVHVDGLSHREAGQALGLGTPSVKVLLFRARRRLAARLDSAPIATASATEVAE